MGEEEGDDDDEDDDDDDDVGASWMLLGAILGPSWGNFGSFQSLLGGLLGPFWARGLGRAGWGWCLVREILAS